MIAEERSKEGQNQKQQGMENWKDQIAREKKMNPVEKQSEDKNRDIKGKTDR